jgi:flotillin
MLGIRVPDPDQAMLISGGKGDRDGAPFRVVVGNRKFVMPLINRVSYLTLAMQEAQVAERCVTNQGIEVEAKAVCAFKVGSDEQSIVNAGQRFLSDQRQMPNLVGQIFAGHLRSIIGSMTVEDLVRNRQALATEVLDASKEEMARLGLLVDSFQIQSIDDSGQGYIAAMAAPNVAAVQREAAIAQARADQAAAEARQESVRQQAQYERDTQIAKAQNAAEVNKAQADADRASQIAQAEAKRQVAQAQADADQAGPLAQAKAEQAVLEAQTAAAAKQAALREQELVAERVKPAQADAEAVKIKAMADAEATTLQAEAAASNGRIALERMIIEQLPLLVANAGSSLARANVTVLNGSDGLSQIASGLVSQALAIYNEARQGLVSNGNDTVAATAAAVSAAPAEPPAEPPAEALGGQPAEPPSGDPPANDGPPSGGASL